MSDAYRLDAYTELGSLFIWAMFDRAMKVELNAYAELAYLMITVGAKSTRGPPSCKPLCFNHDYVTTQLATKPHYALLHALANCVCLTACWKLQ